METAQTVVLTVEEAEALRSRMRDLQAAVSRYYAATGNHGDFVPELRAFITHTQAINDLLTESIADNRSFKVALAARGEDAKSLINGIKYVRNVDQHLLYTVAPDSENVRMVGGSFGTRLFPVWRSVPAEVHSQLRPGTQKLQPAFEDRLVGREISGSMMDVLRLFGALIPDAVHRDSQNEWSGFPLMSQPGMGYPLHPEEPLDRVQVHDWLSQRVPNGDLRVAMGLRIHEGVKYLYGNTWVKGYSFTPFVETVEQVRADVSAGFVYLACEDMFVLKSASDEFPDALQGVVLSSTVDVDKQGPRIAARHLAEEWVTPDSEVFWDDVNIEVRKDLPESWFFEVRRARRLNALVPPSFTRR
ncbi:hypothetical protein LZG07_10925 [Microbacterium profundi]|uniref:hypothetical protein n=1 Tax=Microbacterium profundi TaxID=450380 RepID=UPI001F249529|nr:hypothetical protein [Microbacterium profundi]MCE7482430.1 hypothetical protein [Microbacterium profundi]